MKILIAAQDGSMMDEVKTFLQQHRFTEDVWVQVVHVAEPPPYGYYSDLDAFERALAAAQGMMASLVKELESAIPAVKVEGAVVEGDPKEEIVKLAKSLPADLVIMGSHGRGLLGRLFLGSVSLAVHAAAPCSVLILRPRQEAEHGQREQAGQQQALTTP